VNQEILYGRQTVREALLADRRKIKRIFLQETRKSADSLAGIRDLAGERGITMARGDRQSIERLCAGGNHQGVAAEVSPYPYVELANLLPEDDDSPAILLVLDHVQDPQNLGSLLRTADAAGVRGVIIPKDRAAAVTPAVSRASAGAAEHMPVALVTNLVRTMTRLKDTGFWFYGLEAAPAAGDYAEQDYDRRVGLVVGSEGYGLGRLVRETCDFLIKLPMSGRVTSLNAGVAGAIALYEVVRQNRRKAGEC